MMSFAIRRATVEDIPLIVGWTQDTFSWGDYVSEALPEWLDDQDSLVVVCTDEDVPVAVSRAQMLSPTEAWLSGARVHPDHRRSGMGTAMNEHSVEWARDRGARVARLAVEEWNEAARGQVVKAGFREVCGWLRGLAPPGTGRALDRGQRLQPGQTIDADAAWVFWSQSDLALAGRDLISHGWRWRTARREDLEDAVGSRTLWQSPGGWTIAEPGEDRIEAGWLATTAPDGPLLLEGLRQLARDQRKPEVAVMAPNTAWMREALQREGFETHPGFVYAKGL